MLNQELDSIWNWNIVEGFLNCFRADMKENNIIQEKSFMLRIVGLILSFEGIRTIRL